MAPDRVAGEELDCGACHRAQSGGGLLRRLDRLNPTYLC